MLGYRRALEAALLNDPAKYIDVYEDILKDFTIMVHKVYPKDKNKLEIQRNKETSMLVVLRGKQSVIELEVQANGAEVRTVDRLFPVMIDSPEALEAHLVRFASEKRYLFA